MNTTKPKVYLIANTGFTEATTSGIPCMQNYLNDVGAPGWHAAGSDNRSVSDAEELTEFAGRLCYRSWAPGLNQNVTKVREGNREYLANILRSRHGSVMEHTSVSFVFRHVSRVFTHELVRHRVGVGISQESMRYVRLDGEVPVVLSPELDEVLANTGGLEAAQVIADDAYTLKGLLSSLLSNISAYFHLDDPGAKFVLKKSITSAMRRFMPMGTATDILWTANIRTLRHVIEMRTDTAAEWEIRQVFDQVASYCKLLYPNLFQDFVRLPDGSWTTMARAKALWCLGQTQSWAPPPELASAKTAIVTDTVPVSWLQEWADQMKGNA